MADEQVSAPAGDANGSAAAPESASPPVTDTANQQQETPEQRAARLERELENERRLRLSHQQKVERANQVLAEAEQRAAQQPPIAAAGANPLDQELALAHQNYQALAAEQAALQAKGVRDPLLETQMQTLRITAAGLMERRQALERERALAAAAPVFDADAEYGARAKQLYAEGRAATPADALLMAQGEAVARQNQRKQAERQAQANGDAAARERLERVPASASGGAAVNANGSTIAGTEYLRRIGAGDVALAQQVATGAVRVDYGR